MLSLLTIVYYIARYLLSGIGVSGYTSLIVSIWFFGGLTTLILGVIGIYVANIISKPRGDLTPLSALCIASSQIECDFPYDLRLSTLACDRKR